MYYYYQPYTSVVIQPMYVAPKPIVNLGYCYIPNTNNPNSAYMKLANSLIAFILKHVLQVLPPPPPQQQQQKAGLILDSFFHQVQYNLDIIKNMTKPYRPPPSSSSSSSVASAGLIGASTAYKSSGNNKKVQHKKQHINPYSCILNDLQFLLDKKGNLYHIDLDRCYDIHESIGLKLLTMEQIEKNPIQRHKTCFLRLQKQLLKYVYAAVKGEINK